jgi:hypothetical protein
VPLRRTTALASQLKPALPIRPPVAEHHRRFSHRRVRVAENDVFRRQSGSQMQRFLRNQQRTREAPHPNRSALFACRANELLGGLCALDELRALLRPQIADVVTYLREQSTAALAMRSATSKSRVFVQEVVVNASSTGDFGGVPDRRPDSPKERYASDSRIKEILKKTACLRMPSRECSNPGKSLAGCERESLRCPAPPLSEHSRSGRHLPDNTGRRK